MNRRNIFMCCLFVIVFNGAFVSAAEKQKKYEASWESLKQYDCPEWFRDAKFGIYFHWGVYSVPAFGYEWYPRLMFMKGSNVYKHHLKTYGHPSEFGYSDFVPMFKAEKFNPDEWAELFVKAGARFAGPVAEHHDGFSMWASKASPWNVGNMSPKRDITAELKESISKRGLKFITTFHHARHLQRYSDSLYDDSSVDEVDFWFHWDSHYPFIKGMPTTSDDPQLKLLYGNIPEEEWLEKIWFAKLKEVIDNYQPDIIWFDSWLDMIPKEYRKKFVAYYFNEAQKWEKSVVVVRKQDDLPLEMSVEDLEKSRKKDIGDRAWMTDETISTGSWCYTKDLELKPAADIIHVLADIVSKNGILLLNISPMANGEIPEDQKAVLTLFLFLIVPP